MNEISVTITIGKAPARPTGQYRGLQQSLTRLLQRNDAIEAVAFYSDAIKAIVGSPLSSSQKISLLKQAYAQAKKSKNLHCKMVIMAFAAAELAKLKVPMKAEIANLQSLTADTKLRPNEMSFIYSKVAVAMSRSGFPAEKYLPQFDSALMALKESIPRLTFVEIARSLDEITQAVVEAKMEVVPTLKYFSAFLEVIHQILPDAGSSDIYDSNNIYYATRHMNNYFVEHEDEINLHRDEIINAGLKFDYLSGKRVYPE